MAESATGATIGSAHSPGKNPGAKSRSKAKHNGPKRSLTPRQVDALTTTVNSALEGEQAEKMGVGAPVESTTTKKQSRRTPTPPKASEAQQMEEVKGAAAPKKSNKKSKASTGQKKSGDEATKAKDGRWWASLRDVDPITLVPLSNLKEPPFELNDANTNIAHRFDSKALAIYFLSTGKFVDPINRQEMTREDCLRLDGHLRRYGMGEHARCTDMLDLQSTIKLKPDSAANEAAVLNLRREAGVIAAHLFHYPSARERRPDPRNAPGAGAVNVTDMDEQWESSLPAMVEDDFPDMPVVRRPARADDFPELRPSDQSVPIRAPQRPPAPSVSWASVAETSRTRSINVELPTQPQPTSAASTGAAQPSWRDKSERPKWDFVWLGDAARPEAAPTTGRTQAIFGSAAPVDNSRLFGGGFTSARSTATNSTASVHSSDLLSPYLPRMLKAVRAFGATWMGAQEKRLKEVVDAGTSRKVVQFEPMPEARRKLLQEVAIKFWGLQAVERDPEPNRFLEVSALPGCFTPELTLQRAALVFGDLATAEFFGSAPATNGIMFIGCPSSTSNARVHDLMRSVLQARESEYDIFMLDGTRPDEKNVYVDMSSGERARKFFKRLCTAQHDFRCRKVEWWPCGLDWAKFQIRNGQKVHSTEFQSVRAQRELDERRHRQEVLARTADGAWDDGPAGMNEKKLEAVRARLAQQVDWDDDNDDTPKVSAEMAAKGDGADSTESSDSDDDSDSD